MSLFADASALIALIAGEADQDRIASALQRESDRLWSAMSCWETIAGLRSSHRWPADRARREVETVASRLALVTVAIGEAEREVALDAYERFGRKSGHAAKLNMGDCFAYACARTNAAWLLYKGNDFSRTDLA